MVARLQLLSLGAASAFRCPPVEEGQALKQAGEACGGACRALGECAEGLKCIVPKSSGMSFALLLAPERGGVCTKPEALAVEGRKLGDARELVGSAIDFDLMADKEGLAALRFGVATIAAISEREEGSKADKLELVGVIRSTKQVVAGTKYRVWAELSDRHTHYFEIVDTPWTAPRYVVNFHKDDTRFIGSQD